MPCSLSCFTPAVTHIEIDCQIKYKSYEYICYLQNDKPFRFTLYIQVQVDMSLDQDTCMLRGGTNVITHYSINHSFSLNICVNKFAKAL